MTTSLITGANEGLGHGIARKLLAAGHAVRIEARAQACGRAAAEVAW